MAEQKRADERIHGGDATEPMVRRRGLIAGAAMLAAGLLAKQASEPVAADNGQPLLLGQDNTATLSTSITAENLNGITGLSVTAVGSLDRYPTGIYVDASGSSRLGTGIVSKGEIGISATGTTRYGVQGDGHDAGIYGTGFAGVQGSGYYGVRGDSSTYGVYGAGTYNGAIGVYGTGPSNGVFGISQDGNGVGGQSTSSAGVYGYSASNAVGVQGQSTNVHGVVGYTNATDGHAALIGYANNAGGIGLIANAPGSASPGLAGVFNGDVTINGALRVFGSPKNAAVKHPGDGTYRLLYCEESPESWFADYGRGTLAAGKATITLDPDFAALVHTDTYHVFLTAYGPQQLYVAQQSATGFTVMAIADATQAGGPKPAEGGGTFSWRVVAKRKDIVGERLAKVDLPRTQPAKALPALEAPKVDLGPAAKKP